MARHGSKTTSLRGSSRDEGSTEHVRLYATGEPMTSLRSFPSSVLLFVPPSFEKGPSHPALPDRFSLLRGEVGAAASSAAFLTTAIPHPGHSKSLRA